MKFLTTAALLGATLINSVAAYPHIANIVAEEMTKTEKDAPTLAERQIQPPSPTFNAKEQYVSTKGKYKWVAPGPSDQRGPCPGLNALANHGYMPHNGIGTITDFIESTYKGFGMGRDLGGFLGVYGAIFDGNLRSYSIGFASNQLPVISGTLGTPQGLGGSHNKYENDASPVRGDLYTYGNSYLNQVSLFKEFLSIHNGVPDNKVNYDVDDILHYRHRRFHHSIATNPYFFNGPFSGAIASTAAYTFMYRFMANKSEEFPEGRLSRNDLMHFYSMTPQGNTFKYTPGHERFPENWYKRALNDPYNIPFFNQDTIRGIAIDPIFISIGGNTGKVNTYAGINPANLTGGVYNLQNLKQGNNMACFAFQLAAQSQPDLLEGIYTDVTPAKDKLNAAAAKAMSGLGCPKLKKLQYGQEGLAAYPGYSESYNGYTGLGKQSGGGILGGGLSA